VHCLFIGHDRTVSHRETVRQRETDRRRETEPKTAVTRTETVASRRTIRLQPRPSRTLSSAKTDLWPSIPGSTPSRTNGVATTSKQTPTRTRLSAGSCRPARALEANW